MEQTKALNALEPFLALTKSATAPRAAADLVTQATSNPNTYVFTELLQTPQIRALSQSPEHSSFLQLLEIFSYGTYGTYLSSSSTPPLPVLNDAQALKLRQLSLLTLAKNPQQNLSYAALQQNLGLPDARSVENLVISAIYAGLINAQLDPRNGQVHISSVSHLRDLSPGSTPETLNSLRTWSSRCASTLSHLEAEIANIRASAATRHAEKKAWEDRQAKLMEDEKHSSGAGGDGNTGGGGSGVHSSRQGAKLNRALAKLQQSHQRTFGKRGSGSLDTEVDDDEAMDIDDEEADDAEAGSNLVAALKSKRVKPAKKF
ncbi:PCI domain-containing protein [Xylariaceae sp. FL0255]|nr:PCI domain-containing protein [Xylariaceae sp. FL0255]